MIKEHNPAENRTNPVIRRILVLKPFNPSEKMFSKYRLNATNDMESKLGLMTSTVTTHILVMHILTFSSSSRNY